MYFFLWEGDWTNGKVVKMVCQVRNFDLMKRSLVDPKFITQDTNSNNTVKMCVAVGKSLSLWGS